MLLGDCQSALHTTISYWIDQVTPTSTDSTRGNQAACTYVRELSETGHGCDLHALNWVIQVHMCLRPRPQVDIPNMPTRIDLFVFFSFLSFLLKVSSMKCSVVQHCMSSIAAQMNIDCKNTGFQPAVKHPCKFNPRNLCVRSQNTRDYGNMP